MQTTQSEHAQSGKFKKHLVITRTFHAPRERVWAAWTDPEQAREWEGPHGYTVPDMQIDLREGGTYRFALRSPEGQDVWSTGTYMEIDPPSRLVMTDSFADEKGNVVDGTYYNMSPGFPLSSTVTVTFEEEGPDTRMTLRYDDLSTIADEDLQGMKEGWTESFEKLESYLERQDSGGK